MFLFFCLTPPLPPLISSFSSARSLPSFSPSHSVFLLSPSFLFIFIFSSSTPPPSPFPPIFLLLFHLFPRFLSSAAALTFSLIFFPFSGASSCSSTFSFHSSSTVFMSSCSFVLSLLISSLHFLPRLLLLFLLLLLSICRFQVITFINFNTSDIFFPPRSRFFVVQFEHLVSERWVLSCRRVSDRCALIGEQICDLTAYLSRCCLFLINRPEKKRRVQAAGWRYASRRP